MIVEQIQEREKMRIHEEEIKYQEGQLMKRQIADMQKQEELELIKKHEKAYDLMQEVNLTNTSAKVIKDKRIQNEKDEDRKIVEYNKDKTRKEMDYQMEKERIQREKELETQKLREKQEKAADKQGEIDALRAKRATEEAERQAREKEKQEAITKVIYIYIYIYIYMGI